MPTKIPKPKSKAEEMLAVHIRSFGVPVPVREYRFNPPRRWRVDFAWPETKVAVEVEGGTHSQGRHVRPKGFEADCEKYNALSEQGWTLYRYTSQMVKDGRAIEQIWRVLKDGN